jgi:hypothetical protein
LTADGSGALRPPRVPSGSGKLWAASASSRTSAATRGPPAAGEAATAASAARFAELPSDSEPHPASASPAAMAAASSDDLERTGLTSLLTAPVHRI